MTDEEVDVFRRHTLLDTPPTHPVAEAFLLKGRGAGGTRFGSALNAVYRAITFDASRVAPGEPVTIPLIAKDRKQAKQALGYVRGLCQLPLVAPYVHRGELAETIEFRTNVNVEVMTASFRSARGYTCPAALCDEAAFWFDDGANPDSEILTALRGTLGRVPGSLLLVLSSPYAPRGELFSAVEQYYGRPNEDVLVWNAATRSMNPTYSRRHIEREYKRDPMAAASEYGPPEGGHVVFRQHAQALFDLDAVDAAVVIDRRELPPLQGTRYVAFFDAASGSRLSGDSMTLGIAHKEGARAVLDLIREVEPPFSPGAVIVSEFAPVLAAYGCREVRGDRHAVGFVAEAFAACDIKFIPSTLSKSDLYTQLLLLTNTGALELLDHPTLRTQLRALQRRSVRGGRDSIDHPRGSHDDVANAAAGALVHVAGVGEKRKKPLVFSGSSRLEARRDPQAEMAALIASTKDRLRRAAERDWERAREAEDAPMRGEAVWHVHRP